MAHLKIVRGDTRSCTADTSISAAHRVETTYIWLRRHCCIRCGPDKERILDIVPKEDGARNSG